MVGAPAIFLSRCDKQLASAQDYGSRNCGPELAAVTGLTGFGRCPAIFLSRCDEQLASAQTTEAATIPAAASVSIVRDPVMGGKIEVLDRPTFEKEIKLPPIITDTPANQVTATASLPESNA